jgi:hypothetical protein
VDEDTGLGLRFALASLAVWRITHVLVEEDGPARVVVRLRERLGEGSLGELLDCFYCTSAWVAAPATFVVAGRRREAPLVWLALSGAACLLERGTSERVTPTLDWKGVGNGVLWQGAEGAEAELDRTDDREPARGPSAGRGEAGAEAAHIAASR